MKEVTFQNNIEAMPLSPITVKHLSETKENSFGEMLKSSINEINQLQKIADEAAEKLATGEKKDIHETMIALEKADVSFQLMMQVRNKVVSAYQEINRMSV